MGLFSFFSKRKPEEVYQSIAKKIVVAALHYRQEIEASNNKISADAGAEIIYVLLHLVDRQTFGLLGASRRDTIFDEVSQIAVADYAGAVLNANAPQDLLIQNAEQMMETLNSRQSIYAQCESLVGGSFPSKGTMVFAFSFFVHRVFGHTDRNDVEDILVGRRDLDNTDLEDFPDLPDIMQAAATVGSMVNALRIQDELKHLK